ncbi:hypothetical protein B0I35DRAFT_480521 [Stachybotrys elegans]|uniref:C2H2-type domain-containing protein n=1 Tax=Stachybotrys elegans TaxID=80388 RepID=A0A8K0WPB7_9HYPO|nr:hypothetical protein B0I35DRAFT_480521 [Stachybotrys elegans]
MAATTLPPTELFHYSPSHQVLICTVCRYAVQPTAIARHLKDLHHVYRAARRPYMAYTSTLELRDPELVEPPSPEQFPVAHLPVERGWRCSAPGCGYLCASTKRMENHWPAKHGRKGLASDDWTSVLLQTFFRGNMLQYFTNHPAGYPLNDHVRSLTKVYQPDQVDQRILTHYFASTFESFMLKEDNMAEIWLHVVPGIAQQHPFVFHGIMACTALHMAHLQPDRAAEYTVRALSHQDVAISQFRYAIDHPSRQNANALVAFGYLLTVYSFAADLSNDENPLFIVDDSNSEWGDKPLALPQWLYFVRAGCVMLCDVWDAVETGPTKVLAYAWEVDVHVSEVGDSKMPFLDYFMTLIPTDGSWSTQSIDAYRTAATMLAESFAFVNGHDTKQNLTTWVIMSVWPMRLQDEFIALLSERHAGALILMAYYCVILKRLDGLWYFQGRPAKLLGSILRVLDRKWHPSVQEAIDHVM